MNSIFTYPSNFVVELDTNWDAGKITLPNPFGSYDDLLSKYCLCEVCLCESMLQSTSSQAMDDNSIVRSKHVPFRKESLLISRYRFDLKAEALYEHLMNSSLNDNDVFKVASRKAAPKSGPRCSTRSDYIGVSRNGDSWQSLINVGLRKTYIASYSDERDAAISFDFHSILLHRTRGKSNFSYTKTELIEMILRYKANNFVL